MAAINDPVTSTNSDTGIASEGFSVGDFRRLEITPAVDQFVAESRDVAGVRCEFVVADDIDPVRTILYLHGGAYLRGRPEEYRGVSVPLSRALAARVIVPEYRLAPEHPFPAAYNDCRAVYRAVVETASCARGALAVAGDSAGGALVAAVLADAHVEGVPLPGRAVIMTPYADMRGLSESTTDPRYLSERLPRARIEWMSRAYLSAGHPDVDDPRHSPVHADLHGLPPTLIQIGGRDPFRDDGVRLAARARASGVEVTLSDYPESGHSWVVRGTDPFDPEAARAICEITAFVRRSSAPGQTERDGRQADERGSS